MAPASATDVPEAVAGVRSWYHCLELGPGIVTPGWFDLRPIVDLLPWPDVVGKRCLDVGTADGFFAFELERRGAAEVLALDIPGHDQWDFEPHMGSTGVRYLEHFTGPVKGQGLSVAKEVLGSQIACERISVYDLDPASIGEFDVIVCGSLLLHLRDPIRALGAIRSVCRGSLLCTNQIDLIRSVLAPRSPLVRLDGTSGLTQWWIPNVEGHRQMLRAAGFKIERQSPLYAIPFGPAHPPRSQAPSEQLRRATRRLLARCDGVPHHAILASVNQSWEEG